MNSTVEYSVSDCSLGSVLVASSAKGVCAVLLGTSPAVLKQDLQAQGHEFRTQTDTEVVAHLVEQELKNGAQDGIEGAVRRALSQMRGLFALVIISADDPEILDEVVEIARAHGISRTRTKPHREMETTSNDDD